MEEMSDRRLPNWLASYGKYTAMVQESPPVFHLWTGITTIAGAIGKKIWLPHPPDKLYSNFYVVLVSPPGRSRKSAAIGTGVRFLDEVAGVKTSAEDITREAMLLDMSTNTASYQMEDGKFTQHSSLIAVSKELSVFIGVKDLKLLATLCELYDCSKQFIYRTKGKGTHTIIEPWLSILGGTTPDWLVSSLPMDAIGGGFTSRVLFVVSDDPGPKKPRGEKPPEALAIADDLIHDLQIISTYQGGFKWDRQAGEAYDNWYINHKPATSAATWWLDGYFERKPSHVVKVAMILSIAEGDSFTIAPHHLETAHTMLTEIEMEMPRAFGGLGRAVMSQDIFRVMKMVERKGRVSEAEILAVNWQHFNKTQLDEMVETLVAANKIKRVTEDGRLIYEKV